MTSDFPLKTLQHLLCPKPADLLSMLKSSKLSRQSIPSSVYSSPYVLEYLAASRAAPTTGMVGHGQESGLWKLFSPWNQSWMQGNPDPRHQSWVRKRKKKQRYLLWPTKLNQHLQSWQGWGYTVLLDEVVRMYMWIYLWRHVHTTAVWGKIVLCFASVLLSIHQVFQPIWIQPTKEVIGPLLKPIAFPISSINAW